MEVSAVRRRVNETIERSKRAAVERRALVDDASRAYGTFLESLAVPLFRQVANVLKAEGYLFTVNTPSGSVRLVSDKSGEDYVEIALDTSGPKPLVLGRSNRVRGRRVVTSERPIGPGPIREMTEEQLLIFLLEELEPLLA